MKLLLWTQAFDFLQKLRIGLVEVRIGDEHRCTCEKPNRCVNGEKLFAQQLTILTRTYIL